MDLEQIERVIRVPLEDTSDVSLLRSRIDQQTHLIAILKQRSDDTLKKLTEQRKSYEILLLEKEEWQKLLKSEMEQRQSISKHFKTLSQNHDELIKIKDDYKLANDELRRKNTQLLDENKNTMFPLVQQKEEELTELRNNLEALKTENICLQKSISELKETLNHSQNELALARQHITTYQNGLDAKEAVYTKAVQELQKLQEVSSKNQTKWQNEKVKLNAMLSEKDQCIASNENMIKTLEQNVLGAEAETKSWQKRYKAAAEIVSKDARVKALTEELNSLNLKYENTIKETAAYKKHIGELLRQEKELNARLRHLVE